MKLNYLIVEPHSAATAAVIWMHGLGANGHDFRDIPAELQLPEDLDVRFIFPHAPMQPVTINGGYVMPSWYDLFSLEREGREDENGLRKAQQTINDLIATQVQQGISLERIILAGFSQGGALALFAGLRYPQQLGGIMALSTYLPLAHKLEAELSLVNKSIPIFMAHGTHDAILSFEWAEESRDYLRKLGYSVDWHAYSMEHQLCLEEVRDIREWLVKVLVL